MVSFQIATGGALARPRSAYAAASARFSGTNVQKGRLDV